MLKLHTTYFGPIQWYQSLYRSDCVIIDGDEPWQKQTIRNRCQIATANGIQTLSVPIVHERRTSTPPTERPALLTTKSIRISNHGKWRREHWNALQSAYGESPFFDYYEDDLRPFFTEEWEYLFDFNLAIMHKMCELIENRETGSEGARTDSAIGTSSTLPNKNTNLAPLPCAPRPYYQVYQHKHGFIPNLSILDLLCNMGNEAILYL